MLSVVAYFTRKTQKANDSGIDMSNSKAIR